MNAQRKVPSPSRSRRTAAIDVRSPWDTAEIKVPDRVETPALVVDLESMEANLDEMTDVAHGADVALFPHTKTHRTIEYALAQLAHGADGLTAATVIEVEAFVRGGARRIVMAYPLVGEAKIERIAALPTSVELTAAIDSVEGARAIGGAFAAAGRSLDLLLMVDSGLRRAGVDPDDVAAVGAEIAAVEGVRLRGVMTHEGSVYGAADAADLDARSREAAALMVRAAERLRGEDLAVDSVSLGASASARAVAGCPGVTQLRPGIYAMNDLAQVGLGLVDASRCAARVVATVISNPSPGRACIDAGSKMLSRDVLPSERLRELYPGYGQIVGEPGWRIAQLSEEHGWLRWVGAGAPPGLPIGARLQVIPNHVCPVFSNAGASIAVRDGEIVGVHPVIPRDPDALDCGGAT